MNSVDSKMMFSASQNREIARNGAPVMVKRRYDVRNGKAAVNVDPLLLKRKGLQCLAFSASRWACSAGWIGLVRDLSVSSTSQNICSCLSFCPL